MDWILPVLTMMTFLAFIGWAYINQQRTQARRDEKGSSVSPDEQTAPRPSDGFPEERLSGRMRKGRA